MDESVDVGAEQFSAQVSIMEYFSRLLNPVDDAGKRRTALLQATFDVIAEAGFEGLRTRAVAERAGVNIATLHYYFPSKQELIEGLAQFLGAKFVLLHGPAPEPSGFPGLDRLRQEFSDGRFYIEQEPKMLLVMEELGLRGKRDAEVRKIVEMLQGHWRNGLEEMVVSGLAEGTFRQELGKEEILSMLLCLLSGAASSRGNDLETVTQGIERWLLSDEVWKATRGAEQ
jgi:TetR/AcrR family transcriptional regulator, regulator of cefoperazone and chloramphenicol sensitivity